LLRDLSALSASSDVALANTDLDADLRSLLGSFQANRLVDAFDLVDRAEHALGRNASPKIVADWLGAGI
jgi:hypothetical protein